MGVREVEPRAEIDHRYRQEIGQLHETQHRFVASSEIVGQNHWMLRLGKQPRRLLDRIGIGLKRCRRTEAGRIGDRKSTRLNSSHSQISYAVFCLKKKKKKKQ